MLQAIARANRELGTTVLLVTHDPAVAQLLPRTVTIRDGKIGGEGRLGEEYAVVTADGFLPLPEHALPDLPPGTLVRVRPVPEGFLLVIEDRDGPAGEDRAEEGGAVTGALRAAGVEVRYGAVIAVRAATFAVPPGGMLAVTGPSGAGKTSLLWALAGATPFSGTVEVGGVPVADRAGAAARGIALTPQGNGLPSFLTAGENVVLPLLAAGVPAAEARARARDALALLDLEQSASHLVEELSGGQQQRVALARTLATAPAVLLADEPTSDLDATTRQRVIGALRAQADAGAVVVMATHDAEAAAQLDAELRLDDGVASWPRTPTGWS